MKARVGRRRAVCEFVPCVIALLAQNEEFVNKRNAAVIGKNITPDFYDHDGPGGKPTNVEGDEKMMVAMYKSIPDLHITIEEMIAEGDKVVCRNIWRWTDTSSGMWGL